jgi:hypothetical protein
MISGPHTSGNKGSASVTVCGFVSTVKRWVIFDEEWQEALGSQGFDCFHMTDFVAKKKPFDKWDDSPDKLKKRDRFFHGLVKMAIKRTVWSVAAIVPMDQYNSANEEYKLDECFGGAYAFAGLICGIKLKRWAKTKSMFQNFEVLFEDGDKGRGALDKRLRKLLDIKADFKGKCEFRPFQAADLIAWECAKILETEQAPDQYVGPRRSLVALHEAPKDWGVVRREDIIATCKNHEIPRR